MWATTQSFPGSGCASAGFWRWVWSEGAVYGNGEDKGTVGVVNIPPPNNEASDGEYAGTTQGESARSSSGLGGRRALGCATASKPAKAGVAGSA